VTTTAAPADTILGPLQTLLQDLQRVYTGISDWRYIGVSFAAGLLTFFCAPIIRQLRSSVLVLDAAGLALFAVSGTVKALAAGLNPVAAMLLGVLTGVGGGMLRDVLVSEVPAVLRGELYASAALAGTAPAEPSGYGRA
jgi:uncharacterized membrane protein YeiH